MKAELAERASLIFRDRWVPYPQAEEIERRAAVAMVTVGRLSPHCLLICGPPGAGCSAIAERIVRTLGGGQGANQTKILRVQTPTFADPEAVYASILEANRSFIPMGNATTLRRAVNENLEAVGVELLLLEEIGNLSVALELPAKGALASVRGLANGRRPLICVGASISMAVMKKDPQLENRFHVIQLRPLQMGKEFEEFVGKLTASLPLRHPTTWTAAMLNELYAMSQGLVGRIAPIIEEAAFLACVKGEEAITYEQLRSPELVDLLRAHKKNREGGRS